MEESWEGRVDQVFNIAYKILKKKKKNLRDYDVNAWSVRLFPRICWLISYPKSSNNFVEL